MSEIKDYKPWQQIIMYAFMSVFTIGTIIFIILGCAKYGLVIWDTYKKLGWMGFIVFIIGTVGVGLLWITVNFTMGIIKRIFKLK